LGQCWSQESLALPAQFRRFGVSAVTSTNFALGAAQSAVAATDPGSHWLHHLPSQSRDSPAVMGLAGQHWLVVPPYCCFEVPGRDSTAPLSLDADSKLEVVAIWNGCSD